MGKIKVLQINKLYYPVTGGVERVVQQLAEGLANRADMKVLACQKKGRGTVETINGVEIYKSGSLGVAFSMPVSLSFFASFNRLKKDRDIIHIHMPFPLADIAVRLFGFKGKIVLWWHSDIVKQKKLLQLYGPFLRALLKRADLIITATKGHIDGSDWLPDYRDKCAIIPFGVDTALLKKSAAVSAAPKSVGLPVQFLFVGRLIYYKGCDVLLDAFSKVSGAELVIIGEGPLEPQLKEQTARLSMSGKVRFVGGVGDDELAEAFSACDVFVLPSVAKSEAFGLVQIEAMAYGKPVINTELQSGVPYVSLNGVTGLTVPPSDANALADAMQSLVDEPGLREKFGKAAYERARSEYSMETMLNRVLDEYEKLLGKDY